MTRLLSSAFKAVAQATSSLRYAVDAATYRGAANSTVLDALKDSASGRPLLLVGNGPSLNRTPLEEFTHISSIGMNKIDLLYDRTSWRPDLVLCINNIVARQHSAAIANANQNAVFSWKNRWFMDSAVKQKVSFFLERINSPFSTDPRKYIAGGPTVAYTALQFAYWMGADPVIIFGCDHNFQFSGAPLTYELMRGDDPNHFDPNYFKDSTWGTPDYLAMERCYAEARAAFESDGRKVLDATIGGKLQIFEKISLEEARQLCAVT